MVVVAVTATSATPPTMYRIVPEPFAIPVQPAATLTVYVSPWDWLEEFRTADAGGVTTSPALTEPSVTRIELVVRVATGFTTIVLAGPGPDAVSQVRAKAAGVALKRVAAGSLREQNAIANATGLLTKMFESVIQSFPGSRSTLCVSTRAGNI
jgi:hypothetical protein